jgi:lipopolysaccharide export system permease protein
MKSALLRRYLLRTLALHWVVLFSGLMIIVTVGQLPAILGRAAEHEVASHLVFEVLVLMVVANMPIVILLTLLLAIVATIGRMCHDGEITAMRAAGFSPLNLLAVIAIFSVPLIGLLSAVTHHFAPRAFCEAVLARADAARNILTARIHPGVFVPLGGRGTLFAQQVAADGEMLHVFVSFDQAGSTGVLTAARGRISADQGGNVFHLALYDGEYHEGIPGEGRFRIVRFHEMTRPIIFPLETRACVRPDTRSTTALWGSTVGIDIAELNMRFGQVALAIAFVLVSVPLSITRPRVGAYSRIPLAIGVFALMTFAVSGISTWSAREPRIGSAVFWVVIAAAIAASALWLSSIQGKRMKRTGA